MGKSASCLYDIQYNSKYILNIEYFKFFSFYLDYYKTIQISISFIKTWLLVTLLQQRNFGPTEPMDR